MAGNYMTLEFEGFMLCRLSTDPDPTLEARGTSGYTYALPGENDFDRIIRTQLDQVPSTDFREPFPPYLQTRSRSDAQQPRSFGVYVVRVKGAPNRRLAALFRGAALRLLDDPVFELRNQIVGDGINRIAPPIVPFTLSIERASAGRDTLLQRSDPLDPDQPHKKIWQLSPDDYPDRVPVAYRHLSDEVVETIFPTLGTADDAAVNAAFYAHFDDRRTWLRSRLAERSLTIAQREAFTTRLWAIDNFIGSPDAIGLMTNRLGLQAIWDHDIRGTGPDVTESLRPYLRIGDPWHVRFWMGGWDGDLMVGYMKGQLSIPIHRLGPASGGD